jgi:hypothetical protein
MGLDYNEDNRKDSGNKYQFEVMHTEYNEDYSKTGDNEESLSDNNSNRMMRSNGIKY